VTRAGRDPRNVLFDAALEFGPNWRRDVRSLADERLGDLDEQIRSDLAAEIVATRSAIEGWILDRWNSLRTDWATADDQAGTDFITTSFPWLDEDNVGHALSQGIYYAWHG
jgi:hypothetical protein